MFVSETCHYSVLFSHRDSSFSIEKQYSLKFAVDFFLRCNLGFQCQNCGKPFSIAQLEDEASHKYCVFCRLEQPADFSSSFEL